MAITCIMKESWHSVFGKKWEITSFEKRQRTAHNIFSLYSLQYLSQVYYILYAWTPNMYIV